MALLSIIIVICSCQTWLDLADEHNGNGDYNHNHKQDVYDVNWGKKKTAFWLIILLLFSMT